MHISKERNPFYISREWIRLREAALLRDHYLCQECLKRGIITPANTVHHIKPLELYPESALDIDNLESVCGKCHNKLHPEKAGKKKETAPVRARVIRIT